MKKLLSLVIIAAALVSWTVYPAALIVTEAENDYIKAQSAAGIEYTIKTAAEDIETGDIITCFMLDAGADGLIGNDIVLKYRYSGFTF